MSPLLVIVTMHSPLIMWSRIAYLAGIVLALVLLIPTAWFPIQLGKVSVFALCLLVSVLLFVWGGGVRGLMRAHGIYLAFAVALLPLAYLLSSLFSLDPSLAWVGAGLDTDTIAFTVLGFLAFILAFAHFRTLRTLRLFLVVVGVALAAAAIFQYVSILFGTPLPSVTDRSVNLIGKWNDLGLLVGLLAVLVMARLELGPISGRLKAAGIAALVVLAGLLAFINFSLAWALVLGGAVIIGLVSYLSARDGARLPSLSISVGILAVLCLVFGATFNSALTSVFPVSSLEVRPAAGTTFDLISTSYGGSLPRLLVGTGPDTFSQQWLLNKPAEVNQSQFWSLDFNVGFSTLTTALLSVGLLGVIAWLVPLFLVLAAIVRAVRGAVLHSEDRGAAVSVALAVLFAYAALAFYVPSQNLVLLTFVLSGAAFGFLWRQGRSSDEQPLRRFEQIAMLVVVAGLVGLSVWASVVGMRRLVSTIYVGQGRVALGAADAAAAQNFASSASRVDETPAALQLGIDAGGTRLGQLAQTTTASPSLQAEFTGVVQDILAKGARATELAPNDYRTYLSIGSVYDLLASLRIEGAYQSARSSYELAAKHNPTSPAIPLIMARLEATQGNLQLTEQHLTKALTLKPNYTDAMLFVVQLAVAQNDLPTATRAAESAVQTAPGVASIWFQLGLLYYAGGDTAKAIQPLEQAILLVPDYANAKYFLGVSYYAQKRPAEAMALFEDLRRTNPDATEVGQVLANMQAGKPAFEGIPPQQPPQAPVAE